MSVQKYWKPQLCSAKSLEQFVLASYFSRGFCNLWSFFFFCKCWSCLPSVKHEHQFPEPPWLEHLESSWFWPHTGRKWILMCGCSRQSPAAVPHDRKRCSRWGYSPEMPHREHAWSLWWVPSCKLFLLWTLLFQLLQRRAEQMVKIGG